MPLTPAQPAHFKPVKTIGIVAKTHPANVVPVVREVTDWLAERRVDAVLEVETAQLSGLTDRQTCSKDDLPKAVDLMLVLGGDGTLLGVASLVASANADIPVLAVNCGSLGFLTEITLPELYSALESVLGGTAGIDERQMLRARIQRAHQVIADRLVLNDVVVSKSVRSNIIEISIAVGGQFVTRCRADGLIIASPTGSTAYNLAAGGPIVHPTVDALLLTPIAPHTLTNRPIIIANTVPVAITPALGGSHLEAFASFDGQFSMQLENGDSVKVERAAKPLKVVRSESRNYFAVLREKLKWGER